MNLIAVSQVYRCKLILYHIFPSNNYKKLLTGHLFSKTNQQIIQFGSYIGAYDHIWAYHEGISLETLGENRKNTLIILDIADVEKLMKVLNRIVAKEYLNKEILPNINKLPIRLTDVDLYFIIRDLIEARIYDWYRYEIE